MTNQHTELDEIMDKIFDLAYDHLPDRGIAIGTDRIKQSILDWHDKQIEAVLDRLQESTNDGIFLDLERAIEAERNKLKGSKNDQL